MGEYTPTTGHVRDAYCHVQQGVMGERGDAAHERFHAEFDRWLAAHDREIAAKALREAAERELTRSRADLEAAAAEKYPHYVTPTWEDGATKEDVVPSFDAEWQNAEADMQRAAYIQGRLDQAEADAQIADGRMHPDSRECVICDIAAEIRKGVE
jgi:hypothetical protein